MAKKKSDHIELDWDSLTLAEAADIEDVIDAPLESVLVNPANSKKARAMLAFAWIAKRREDPNFTLEDAGKLSLTIFTPAMPENPTPAAG